MFLLAKQFRFEASHVLPNHDGKCARLHGHSWIAVVEMSGDRLHHEGPSAGMLMDFAVLKNAVQPIIDSHLDHYHLNESLGLTNPTSEAVAAWLYSNVRHALSDEHQKMLRSVRIEETCTSACTYQP